MTNHEKVIHLYYFIESDIGSNEYQNLLDINIMTTDFDNITNDNMMILSDLFENYNPHIIINDLIDELLLSDDRNNIIISIEIAKTLYGNKN